MRSGYKRLGDYIRRCDEFNEGFAVTELLGINNNKYFQRSHTNTIDIDLSKYRIVRNGQFAFNRATTRNGDKISIALRTGGDCIVSPSYRVFESKDENILNSEYLMMWFRRPEFDRYARFKSHGSAHEFFDLEEMFEVELPIPHIDKQREIVREYNVIVDRIALNERLCQKLEETAQAIYKQWFVDFEFPDENGKPYKSSGGAMVYNKELDKEVPVGWEAGCIRSLAKQFSGFAFEGAEYSFDDGITVLRGENVSEKKLRWDTHKKWGKEINSRIESCFLQDGDIVVGMDGSKVGKNWARISKFDLPLLLAQRVACIRPKRKRDTSYLYYSLWVHDFYGYVSQVQTGTSIPHISGKQIEDFPVLCPLTVTLDEFSRMTKPIVDSVSVFSEVNHKLRRLQELLLSSLATIKVEFLL